METVTELQKTAAPAVALNDKAMTINLRISQWTARKYDAQVSKEVDDKHNAKDAGRYNKMLVSKESLKDVQKAISKLRTFHYLNTLPWNDNGERLLPAANYLNYVAELNELRKSFDDATREFVANYDSYVQEARTRLGDMFRESDYPTKAEIEYKFGVKPAFMPVPETDFRISGLSAGEAEKLKTAAQIEIQERLKDAMKDIWTRIRNILEPMKQKLSEKDSIFRDSLFGNLEELIGVLPRLNVTNDPAINEIYTAMKSLMMDPDNVRSDNGIRNQKAKEVEDLMEKYKDYF
jgi:hypothetical protein